MDYYSILGVDRTASDEEIKKAYKKAAIKYHPDRLAGKTDKEKEEGEKKFKEINEAYQVLSDPQKKSNYDNFGSPDGQAFNGFDGFDPFGHFRDFFGGAHFGGNRGGFNAERNFGPGETIRKTIQVDIKDIMNGCRKTINYIRKIKCKRCNGSGGTGKKTCPHCHGTGKHSQVQQTPFGTISVESPCPHCGGVGYTVESICKHCNGTGFENSNEVISFDVYPGVNNGEGFQFAQRGSESKSPSMPNGDLVVNIQYNLSKEFAIKDGNVYQQLSVQYYDAILGVNMEITLGNGKRTMVYIPPSSKPDDMILVPNEGIKYPNGMMGKYFVVIKYVIPNKLSENEKSLLEQIRNKRN